MAEINEASRYPNYRESHHVAAALVPGPQQILLLAWHLKRYTRLLLSAGHLPWDKAWPVRCQSMAEALPLGAMKESKERYPCGKQWAAGKRQLLCLC